MEKHDIQHLSFSEWFTNIKKHYEEFNEDCVVEYLDYLRYEGSLHTLLSQITEEVFYILFQNRLFLKEFNEYVASYIESTKIEDLSAEDEKYFQEDSILKRTYIPVWVRNSVFFRDKGIVAAAIGLISVIDIDKSIDHIVPLAQCGSNDISNLQLLCSDCNSTKNDRIITYKLYQLWYEK